MKIIWPNLLSLKRVISWPLGRGMVWIEADMGFAGRRTDAHRLGGPEAPGDGLAFVAVKCR